MSYIAPTKTCCPGCSRPFWGRKYNTPHAFRAAGATEPSFRSVAVPGHVPSHCRAPSAAKPRTSRLPFAVRPRPLARGGKALRRLRRRPCLVGEGPRFSASGLRTSLLSPEARCNRRLGLHGRTRCRAMVYGKPTFGLLAKVILKTPCRQDRMDIYSIEI